MCLLVLALIAAAAPQSAPPRFRAVLLETVDAHDNRAWDINDLGEIVGVVQNASLTETAASWNDRGELSVLGRAETPVWSTALAINNRGFIVGAGGNHAPFSTLWTLTGGGPLLPWNGQALAVGVNDSGTILL
jgi:uncharacterized membrane protein